MPDYPIRSREDCFGGTVVLLQLNNFGAGILVFKLQDVADISAAEAIDGLVIITDHTKIFMGVGQEAYQLKLRVVGILVLVYHDIPEMILP